MRLFLLSVLVFLLSSPALTGQRSSELGLFLTSTDYLGDLSRDIPGIEDLGWGVGFTAKYMFNRHSGVRVFIGYLDFYGSDLTVPRNADRGWETDFGLLEASIGYEYHPFGEGRYNLVNVFNKFQLSPYGYIGIGTAMGDAEVFVSAADMGKFPEEADRDLFVCLPIGGGVRFDISEYAIITLDIGVRAVFSDYLDGISQGSDRNDWYGVGGLTFSILLDGEMDRNL